VRGDMTDRVASVSTRPPIEERLQNIESRHSIHVNNNWILVNSRVEMQLTFSASMSCATSVMGGSEGVCSLKVGVCAPPHPTSED
jgi:hypothetical protein